jgi:colanic acid/amylovoran biosynthesis protein
MLRRTALPWLSDWIANRRAPTLFLIPPDPWNLTGSTGDAAMITAVAQEIRTRMGLEVTVLTTANAADIAASRLGLKTLRVRWDKEAAFWVRLHRRIRRENATAVLIIGADVLDGCYDSEMPSRMLRIADLAASRKIPTAILGFSFNSKPKEDLHSAWSELHPDVVVQVRDEPSLKRLEVFSGRKGRLVADCAFLLREKAGPASERVRAWTSSQRQQGKRILGINFHPLLFKNKEDFHRLSHSFQHALGAMAARGETSFVVIPHDNREGSDKAVLQSFTANLGNTLRDHTLFVEEEVGPDEIKSIVSHLDGVITGRMHLAIASLGMGKPVLALTYQDKFEGLFGHFELPSWLLATPEAASNPADLLVLMDRFSASIGPLTNQVEALLPAVQLAARRNLEPLGF